MSEQTEDHNCTTQGRRILYTTILVSQTGSFPTDLFSKHGLFMLQWLGVAVGVEIVSLI